MEQAHIVLPVPVLRSVMAQFVADPGARITSPLGLSRLANGQLEWLVRPAAATTTAATRPVPPQRLLQWIFASGHGADAPPSAAQASPARSEIALVLAETLHGVTLRGYLQSGHAHWRPVNAVRLVGAGLHCTASPWPSVLSQALGLDPAAGRWSRTAGALGGDGILERLRALKWLLVGAGRTGSLLAAAVARLGSPIALVDPDRIELHNLGEMEAVGEGDIGSFKAAALARALTRLTPAEIVALNRPILDPAAMAHLKACDVVACCVDNDAARLALGILATLYHKPLCDIGSGVFLSGRDRPTDFHRGERTMGTEVRLLLPADGCLRCRGGLTDFDRAIASLANAEVADENPADWRRQRAGSLRSLNQMATGLALQMVQDLVAARLTESTWARLEISADGRADVSYPPIGQAAACPLCALSGLGDDGLEWLPGHAAANLHL